MRRPARRVGGIWRVVAERLILDQVPDHVDAKAVDAALQPEAHRRRGWPRAPRDCASSGRAAGQEMRDSNTGRWRRRIPRRCRRTPTASCWAGRRPGAGSRQMYQSRLGLSREARLSRNQGCWSEVWLGTRSRMTLSPRRMRGVYQRVEVGQRAE